MNEHLQRSPCMSSTMTPTLLSISVKADSSTLWQVRLQRLPGHVAADRNNVILGKLEGNNPAGSVKDRCSLLFYRLRAALCDEDLMWT